MNLMRQTSLAFGLFASRRVLLLGFNVPSIYPFIYHVLAICQVPFTLDVK
jgi:hypothetical protein